MEKDSMKRLLDMFEQKELTVDKGETFIINKSLLEVGGKREIFLEESIEEKKAKDAVVDFNKKNISIIAIGDVGGTLALGLRLLGGDVISQIGLFDINTNNSKRYEFELNQINSCHQENGEDYSGAKVTLIEEETLYDSDIILFCATLGIPKVGEESEGEKDVRMIQLEKNKGLVKLYAKACVEKEYRGKFYVVSDPVDPLCKAALQEGLLLEQVRGFGLGVMNARAKYYSQKSENPLVKIYNDEGRAFGPHGGGLVIANSIENYNGVASLWLTEKAEKANLEMRELGFKPFIAPALSSGVLSLIDLLKGRWNYSSIYFGKNKDGAFWGCRNKENGQEIEVENIELPPLLAERILASYKELSKI